MKTKLLLPLLGLVSLAASASVRAGEDNFAEPYKAAAQDIKKEKDQLAVESTLLDFAEVTQMAGYFKDCYGCAIFPTIGKGGLAIGVGHGKGWIFKEHRLVGESEMTQLTLGFQAGGQAFSQIVFFEDERAYNRFTCGTFEFAAQASAAAITKGANATTSTAGGSNAGAGNAQAKKGYTDGMAVFTKLKGGLMYEAAVGGQKFTFKSLE